MQTMRHFPLVITRPVEGGIEALGGLALDSILSGGIFLGQKNGIETDFVARRFLDPADLQQRREALVSALCAWDDTVNLELHLCSSPDLMYRARGNLLITLFLRVTAPSEDVAKESLVMKYLALMPLLCSHLPEAEMVPVTETAELELRRLPFKPTHAVAVQRRQENLALGEPLPRGPLGFLAAPGGLEPLQVDFTRPWVPALDSWEMLCTTLMAGLDPLQVIVRLEPARLENAQRQELMEVVQACETMLAAGVADQVTLQFQVTLTRDVAMGQLLRLSGGCCHLGVFLLAGHPLDAALVHLLGRSITGDNLSQNPFTGGFACHDVPLDAALNPRSWGEAMPFTPCEAAAAFRLPSPPIHEGSGLPLRRSRTAVAVLPPLDGRGGSAVTLCLNRHAGQIQPVQIDIEDRMRHTFLLGQTGTGKSTLMESLVLQDIRAGRGLALIDPHGDLVDDVLSKIPRQRWDDVILFDVTDRERPPGFNLFEYKDSLERDLLIDELYHTLDSLYDMRQTGGPIFESNFRGMLKLLLPVPPRHDFTPTVLEFTLCYLDRDFRNWLRRRCHDEQALDFIRELERTGGDASLENLAPYITSKFNRFVQDTTLRRIVGQERTSFDFEQVMQEGRILLVKLAKGRFGSVVSALLANQLVSRFKLAALQRGDLPREQRRDFFLYVDEAHNLPAENLMQLLSEARKYRLGLVLATQYAAQLAGRGSSNHNLLSAVLGNVGATLVFRLGREDADLLAPLMAPQFLAQDIVGLPNWQGCARLQLSNDSLPAFSFHSLKDETRPSADQAEVIRRLSRSRYGMEREMIDAAIDRRRRCWRDEEA